LLVGEIALTVVLLVGAGLMVRSFLNMQRWDVGIATKGVVMARVELPPERYRGPADLLAFEERLMERLDAMGGAFAVTIASDAPGSGAEPLGLRLQDRDVRDRDGHLPEVSTVRIAAGYFSALDARLLQGREFEPADGRPGAEAVIVNEPFAAKYWPGENPIGKRIQVGGGDGKPWLNVVGVSPAILQHFKRDLNVPTVYVPYRQNPVSSFFVLARGSAAADRIAPALRAEISALDSDLPLIGMTTLDEYLRNITWGYRLFSGLFSIFAFIALLMSSVGIYSATAYGISQRTQEIGIRLALGATRQSVAWMVLRQGLIRIAAGLALGLIGALALSGAMQMLLYNVTPTDPLTFVLITGLLGAVTTAACLIPARRAMSLDPSEALRQDG
jgi:predicted permease